MLKKIQFLLLFLFATQFIKGQSSPVQINPQVIPPAPIYFADYANKNVSNSPLRLQLLLRDVTLSNIQVRLKVSFSGKGINFQSNNNVIGAQPIILEGGKPVVLQSVDLAPYFEYQNITGIAPTAYSSELSEGSYQICFEVFEALTNRRLSQKSCVTTYIFKNNPPILVAPANQSNVTERTPQNIVFQWTPRAINVSNVEYELSLVEVWDRQVDPQTAFLTTPPVFQTTTSATSFVYDASQALLLPNKKYAWRIQAKAKQGTENIGLFKNRGYSQIFSFSYATPCNPPSVIKSEPKGANQANISWEDIDTNIPTFKVRYRKQGNTKWFTAKTTSNWLTLWDLKPNTTYEYQVSKVCSVFDSNWSLLKTVKTQTVSEANDVKQCGISPKINLDNVEPLPNIKVNDGFKAGDFDVKVLEVQGSNGRFTGKGFIRIPYLNSIKVGVEFTNILINTDKQLAEGMVITAYDINAGNIIDVDKAIDTVTDVVDSVHEVFEGENDLKDIKVDFKITSADIKVTKGKIVITNPETGETKTYPANDDTVITDKAGNTYHIDEQTGKVTKGGQIDYTDGGSPASADSGNMVGVQRDGDIEKLTAPNIVTFESANGRYGFDAIPQKAKKALSKQYETIKDTYGNDYTLVHQAVAKGDTTKIIAKIDVKNNDYTASNVIFKTKQGEKLPAEIIGKNKIEVTLTGRYTFEHETIYAVVNSKADATKQLTAGAFTLWHLTPRTINVNIVPVGNPSISDVDITTVKNIFARGIATINIQKLDTISLNKNILGGDKTLEIGDSAWLSTYNKEQKDIIAHLKSQIKNFDNNAYYVFVFDDSTKTTKNIAGFMPLQRQFGFVFAGKTNAEEEGKNSLGGVLAHELGHGIFALQHPFTKYKTPEKTTGWLMDYGDGTALSHLDWKQMHDPALKFYIFQKEEDGEYKANSGSIAENLYKLSKDYGYKHFAIKHCNKCENSPKLEKIDGSKFNLISDTDTSKIPGEIRKIAKTKDNKGTLMGWQFVGKEKDRCLILYYKSGIASNDLKALEDYKITPEKDLSKGLWFIDLDFEEKIDCSNSMASLGCPVNPKQTDSLKYSTYFNNLYTAIISCLNRQEEGVAITSVQKQLKDISSQLRKGQKATFYFKGNVYQLNASGELENVKEALSNADLRKGKWTDSDEVKMRFAFSNKGILQLKAVGIKSGIVKQGKTIQHEKLAESIELSTNKFFTEYAVKTALVTPQQLGKNLNDGKTFADGDQMKIDNSSSFIKIASEGLGVVTTLLKKAEVEDQVYLNSKRNETVIHAPGLVTGTVEAGTTVVTDLTSMGVMVYDLAVDKKTRTKAYNGLVKLKTAVGDNPKKMIPMFVNVLVSAVTGNSQEEWKSLKDSNIDEGEKNHKISKGVVTTVKSVFAAGTLISKLDDIAEALIKKLDEIAEATGKSIDNIKKLVTNLDTDLLKRLNNWSADELVKLDDYLKKYTDLAKELSNPKIFEAVEKIIKNPQSAWDVLKEYDLAETVIEKLGKSAFFKEVIAKGRKFEKLVSDKIKNISPFNDLFKDYKHLKQIYLKGDVTIIADDLFLKVDFDRGRKYYKAVISDSKLTNNSPWTSNQKQELIDVFKNNPNKKYIELEVRTAQDKLKNFDLPDNEFSTGRDIRIYKEDIYKIISDGNNNILPPIKIFE